MAEARHGFLTVSEGVHIPYQWSYANAAARTGASGFAATDVGKLARQVDDNSLWMLTVTTPTWIRVAGPRTRKFLVPIPIGYDATTDAPIIQGANPGIAFADPDSCYGVGQFIVPNDFASGLTVSAVVIAAASGDAYVSSDVVYGALGQAIGTHTAATAIAAVALTADLLTAVCATSLASAAIGDIVGYTFVRDATNVLDTIGDTVLVVGLLVSYTADS